MKKRLNKKKEMTVPLWIMDGFVGVLALFIYNFALYLLTVFGVGGFVAKLEDAVGYFGINSYIDFGFSATGIFFGVVLMFVFAFVVGVITSSIVRKKNKGRIV